MVFMSHHYNIDKEIMFTMTTEVVRYRSNYDDDDDNDNYSDDSNNNYTINNKNSNDDIVTTIS